MVLTLSPKPGSREASSCGPGIPTGLSGWLRALRPRTGVVGSWKTPGASRPSEADGLVCAAVQRSAG